MNHKKKVIASALALGLLLSGVPSAWADQVPAQPTSKAEKKAENGVWKQETAELRTQLVALRTQQKALIAQIKELRAANKANHKALSPEAKAAAKETLKQLGQQIQAQRTTIETLRTQKAAQWAQLKAAKAANNVVAGEAALEQIVALKGQIIQAQETILLLQQSLQAALAASL